MGCQKDRRGPRSYRKIGSTVRTMYSCVCPYAKNWKNIYAIRTFLRTVYIRIRILYVKLVYMRAYIRKNPVCVYTRVLRMGGRRCTLRGWRELRKPACRRVGQDGFSGQSRDFELMPATQNSIPRLRFCFRILICLVVKASSETSVELIRSTQINCRV